MRFVGILLLLLALLPAQQEGLPLCSQAIHDQAKYKAQGPDGWLYPSYHPQIDGREQCHFDHEHGSDPALFDPTYRPLYGYTASKHGMAEGHAGFKGYAVRLAGHSWYILHHFGTANAALAACTRHHTLDVTVRDDSALLSSLHLMADFGRAVENTTGAILTPPACPAQGSAPPFGTRQLPVSTSGAIGYEPWRADARGNIVGLSTASLTINTRNPQTACDVVACDAAVSRPGALGTLRTIQFYSGFGITAMQSGLFWTDPMGMQLRGAGDADAVQQYVAPGLDVYLSAAAVCQPFNAAAYIYDCRGAVQDEWPFLRNPFVTGAN